MGDVALQLWLLPCSNSQACWRRFVFDPGADFGLTHSQGLPSRTQQRIHGIALGHGKSAAWVHLASAPTVNPPKRLIGVSTPTHDDS